MFPGLQVHYAVLPTHLNLTKVNLVQRVSSLFLECLFPGIYNQKNKSVVSFDFGYHDHMKATNNHYQTALHLAVFNGHADTVRWLVQHGADVNVQDNEGQTPFSIASGRGNRKVARLLSDLGS